MIQVICGEKGTGKTKEMLSKVDQAVKDAKGEIVYIDKSTQHMYELSNQVRLVNISEYPVNTCEGFLGFVSGLLAGNHDIETVFFDSLLKISCSDASTVADVCKALDEIGSDVNFVVSISLPESELPDSVKEKIIASC